MDKSNMRRKLDERYQEAVKALEIVESFFGGSIPSSNGTSTTSTADQSNGNVPLVMRPRKGSHREKVFNVIKDEWATIDEIAKQTEIDAKKIRGVVNAPVIKDMIETKMDGERKLYRVKPKKKEEKS